MDYGPLGVCSVLYQLAPILSAPGQMSGSTFILVDVLFRFLIDYVIKVVFLQLAPTMIYAIR